MALLLTTSLAAFSVRVCVHDGGRLCSARARVWACDYGSSSREDVKRIFQHMLVNDMDEEATRDKCVQALIHPPLLRLRVQQCLRTVCVTRQSSSDDVAPVLRRFDGMDSKRHPEEAVPEGCAPIYESSSL